MGLVDMGGDLPVASDGKHRHRRSQAHSACSMQVARSPPPISFAIPSNLPQLPAACHSCPPPPGHNHLSTTEVAESGLRI